VTLERVSDGIKVTGDGLKGVPRVKLGGAVVWLDEDASALKGASPIDPKQSFDAMQLTPARI